MAATEIRFPLLCRAVHLTEALPAQPEAARYAVVTGGLRAPDRAIGYLVEFTGKRTGYVIACLVDGGYAYACDGPIDELPAGKPAIRLVRYSNREGGCVMATAADGAERQVSEFRDQGSGYVFRDPVCDLGAYYSSHALNFSGFLAVAFLAFRHLPEQAGMAGAVGRTMGDVLDEFCRMPVADAVDALVTGVASGERASGFERYAARILTDADPAGFRAVAAAHELELRRLGTTGLFWISCYLVEFDDDEAERLLAMEGALNRLALIERTARQAGADGLLMSTEAHCADEDWRQIRSIAAQGARLLARSSKENPLLTLRGVAARRGGEWDLRTRVAANLEHLLLPYRVIERFTVDAAAGSVTIACWAPSARTMPRWRRPAGSEELAACDANCDAAASAYAMRLAALLMAVAFGAGAGVTSARVVLCADRGHQRPVFEATISRTGFVTGVHEHLCADDFSDPDLTWGASRLKDLLAPADVSCELTENVSLVELYRGLVDPDSARRPAFADDARPLPAELATMLHAATVRELDVFNTEDPFVERFKEASSLAERDPAAAAQRLSDLLAVMEVVDDVSGADGDAPKPLYCVNTFARLAMALVEDDPAVRYRNVPDSVYETLLMLADLCADNSDAAHALDYARRAIELGPTSSRGYVAAGSACVDLGDFEQAIEFYRRALMRDVQPNSYNYTYYRLAYALWRAGRADAALACYARAMNHPQMAASAREEMRDLMSQVRLRAVPTERELDEAAARSGVPDAPTKEALDLAARVFVAACDAGLLNVACVVTDLLGWAMRDDVVSTALRSCRPWEPARF